jgi:hypothetical protein
MSTCSSRLSVFAPLELDMVMDPSAQFPDKAVSYERAIGGGYEEVGFLIDIDGGLFDMGEWEGFTTALDITADRRVAAAVACNSEWLVPSATATILTLIWSDTDDTPAALLIM